MHIGSVVIGAQDVSRAMAFWATALDYVPRDEPDDTWVVLKPRSGEGHQLAIGLSDTPVQEYPRVHLDIYSETPREDIERLLALGASTVDWDKYPPDPDFTVLADTEGNRFCVIDVLHGTTE